MCDDCETTQDTVSPDQDQEWMAGPIALIQISRAAAIQASGQKDGVSIERVHETVPAVQSLIDDADGFLRYGYASWMAKRGSGPEGMA